MAQTKRKRRTTKHRGNAAGQVEARGRTSRAESGGPEQRGKPGERFDKPPNWRSAMNRAAIAALIFAALSILLLKQKPLTAAAMTVAVFCFYVPLGYYTDSFIYQRRMRKKQEEKGK